MKNIGRNELCICGSGKKYKKCCLNTRVYELHPHDKIVGEYLDNIPPYEENEILWRTSYTKLPQNIVEDIDDYLSLNTLYKNMCWYNSHNLSLSVDGIDVVNGWYGWKTEEYIWSYGRLRKKEVEEYIQSLRNECVKLLSKDKRKRLFKFTPMGTIHFYDFYKDIIWYRHSWNKCGDIHFDLTTELNNEFVKTWTMFNESETFDTSSIKVHKELHDEYRRVIKQEYEFCDNDVIKVKK